MAQSTFFFTGFETGDASEVNMVAAGGSIQGSTVRSGAYALKCADDGVTLFTNMSATQSVARFWIRVPSLPGSIIPLLVEAKTAGAVARTVLSIKTDGTLQVSDNAATLGLVTTGGTHAIATNTWTMVEFALDLAAGGIVKTWVSGTLDINTTHSSNVSAAVTDTYSLFGQVSPNEVFLDDIRVDQGGVTRIGDGKTIARQGKAGTPTYNSWTKNGDTTAALCWSETPFSTGKNCSSSSSAAAQTMLVEKFSITQSGHGSEVIGAGYTINACKTSIIGKRATSGNPSIRRRIGGVDTDTAKTLTASDTYFDDGVWTTTTANLDSMEAGMVKAADANLTTIEDVWVHVEYIPLVGRSYLIAIM